MESIIGHNF